MRQPLGEAPLPPTFIFLAAGKPLTGQFNNLQIGFGDPSLMTGSGLPLGMTYVSWIIVIARLYPNCVWRGRVKRTRKAWWLS